MKKTLTPNRPVLWGFLGFSVLNLVLFGDLLGAGKSQVLSSPQADLFFHFAAWRQFGFEQLRQGHLTLWNPYYLCGAPFFGGFEAALLYPPNWLYLVLPLGPAINLGIILHVILAGFFTYLWALQRGLNPIGAFLAGVVFMWGGAYYLHLFAGHLPNLCTMAWAPLIFLCVDGLAEKVSSRWILLGIFAVSMQILAGHPQYAYFTAILIWIYALISLGTVKFKRNFIGSLTLVYLGAFFLTAVQLWTGIEAFTECGRNIPLEIKSASSFSFPPENVLTLFLPSFFGNLTTSPYWGRWYLWEVSLFIGGAALFLIAYGAWANTSTKRAGLLWVAGLSFVFSLGAFTPLYNFFYAFIPFFKGLRGPCKFDFLTALSLAMLAGMGADRMWRQEEIPRRVWKFVLAAGLTLTCLGLFVFLSAGDPSSGLWAKWFTSIHWLEKTVDEMNASQREQYVAQAGYQSARALWSSGGLFLLIAFLLRALRDNKKKVYALVALGTLELFFFAHANRPTFDLSTLQKKFDAVLDFHSKNPGDYRVYGTGSASLVTGLGDIWEDEPMVLGRYGRFVCRSQNLSENQLFSVVPIFREFPPVLGMLRLKYGISFGEDPIRIAPLPFKQLPRMQLMSDCQVVPEGRNVLDEIFKDSFNPFQKVFLENRPDPFPGTGENAGKVEWKDLSTEKIEITADLPKPEILLITDNYSQGWHATAVQDSIQNHYQVVPADYFLRAVPLFKGHNHFYLEYRPWVFETGKWVSIASLILYVVLFSSEFRRKSVLPLKAKK